MAMTKEQLEQLWSVNPLSLIREFGRILRDFGYNSLTDEWVKTEIERLKGGGEAHGGPSMFIAGWLKDGID